MENDKKVIGYIYKITSPEGREYIGLKKSEVFVESYWSSSQNEEYWNDLKKFGKDKFKREIICWCYSLEELNEKEQYWIEHSNALANKGGYNLCTTFPQIVWTDSMKLKNSIIKKEYFSHKENKIKISIAMKNSEKYKESRKTVGKAISKSLLNLGKEEKEAKYSFTQTAEFKEKIKQNSIGKHWYNNGKENIFAIECPEGYVEGMLETKRKGQQFTEEHKESLSKARIGKRWWTNGIDSICDYECPEGWYAGRTVKRDQPKKWWNNGKENKQAIECPGKDWVLGRLNSFNIDISDKDLMMLYNSMTVYKLAKIFNTTISAMKSFLKRRGLNTKK